MTQWLKQSVAATIQFGPFLDATNAVDLEVGLATAMDNVTTGIRISKNGANIIARNATVTTTTYDEMGLYVVTLDATDTGTLGNLKIIFEEAATCLPVWQDFMIVPANVWDSMFGATSLKVDVETIKTQAVTCAAGVTVNPSVGAATIQPTVTEFNARSLASADYTIVSDLGTVQTGDSFALIGTAGVGLTNLGGSANDWNIVVPDASGVAPTTAEIATGVWTDTTAGDFTTALSVGKSVMNGVTLGTGLTTASVSGAVGSVTATVTADVDTIKTQTVTCAAGVTVNPSVGAATIQPTVTEFNARSLASADYTIVSDLGTVQTGDSFALIGTAGAGLTNLGASANDWNTVTPDAAGVAPTTAEIATGVWTDATAGDFTAALSVGKSVMNGVALGTGLTTVSVSGAVGSVTGAVGSVSGNVDGTVASVVGAVGSVTATVTADVDTIKTQTVTCAAGVTVNPSVGAATIQPTVTQFDARTILSASYFDWTTDTVANVTTTATNTDMLTAAAVNAEVVDALNVDTYAEPGQETPTSTTSLVDKIGYLYKNFRNRKTQTATVWSLYNDDATTVGQKSTVSDDATTADKTEIITGV